MFNRIGNDVLRAVALLLGLLVGGSFLFAVRDTRVAQFVFEHRELGTTGRDGAASIALDARTPEHIYVAADARRPSFEGLTDGPVTRTGAPGDLATDGAGNVYLVRATGGRLSVSLVDRRGRARLRSTIAGGGHTVHAVAREDGLLVISAYDRGGDLRVWTSTDRGLTFRGPKRVLRGVAAAGPVTVGPFKSLFTAVVTTSGHVGVVASADGGVTWSTRGITTASDIDPQPPSVAIDDAATVYVAYSSTADGSSRVWLAHSRDVGQTWANPIPAAPHGSTRPQLVAGSLGKVGLAYLHREELVYRHTTEALLPTPFWTENLITREVRCRACAYPPFELTLTTKSMPLLVARAGGRVVVAQQSSGRGVR